MIKRKNRNYSSEFKPEAVALVTEQGYSVPKAAAFLGGSQISSYITGKPSLWQSSLVTH
jgi:transposase-like protein